MRLLPVQDIFKAMGINPRSTGMMPSAVDLWRGAYQGDPPWVGNDMMDSDDPQLTVGFPSMVCRDIAQKSVSELVVNCTRGQGVVDDDAQAFFNDRMLPFFRDNVEYTLALGGVVIRPWYDQTAKKVRLGWYQADMVLPTDWDGRLMTGAVLVDRIRVAHPGSFGATFDVYTKLEAHIPQDNGKDWVIRTKVFKSFSEDNLGVNVPLSTIPQWAGVSEEVTLTNLSHPPFVYMRTPWANNKEINNPIGTSLFADAIPSVRALDDTYSSLFWETHAGKTAVFVDDSMVPQHKSSDGKTMISEATPLERHLYRKLDGQSGDNLFEPFSPQLRVDQLNGAIKTHLAFACSACHLDSGAYIWDSGKQAVTATQVRADQQKTYGTIVDIQGKMITPVVTELVDVIRNVQILYQSRYILPDDLQIGMHYGDSILVDEETERANAQAEVAAGLRSKKSYLMKYRGMTEGEADNEIAAIKSETPVTTSFFGS